MNKNSEQTSFRRGGPNKKLIEELAPQRRAEALSAEQNDELSNLNTTLTNTQAATELVSEAIEDKGNQIIENIQTNNGVLQDISAGVELTAEATEKTQQGIKNLTDILSDKLDKLSAMISGKIGVTSPVAGSESLKPVEDALPEPEENKPTASVPALIPPEEQKPDADFIPEPEQPKNDAEGKETNTWSLGDKLDTLSKITEKGFKASISVADRISGMLFKYTITAAAEAAKLIGGLLLLVFGIDAIRVYFQYFMKQFEKGWVEFNNKFKEWGPLLEGLMTWAKNAEAMFSQKNWLGLAEAIIRGMVNLTKNMAQLLMLGISKLISAILSKIPGMGDLADNVEASALMSYQQNTGATLDDEDQTKIAKYHDKRSAESMEAAEKMNKKYKDKPELINQAEKYGNLTKEQADQLRAGGIDTSFRDLPEEERLDYFKKRDKAQADIIRLTQTADNLMKPDATDKKNAMEMRANIEKQLADPAMAKGGAPKDLNMRALLEKLDKSLEKFKDEPKVKPPDVKTSPDAQQAAKVDEGMKAKENKYKDAPAQAQINTVNNIQKTSRTQYNMPPQSSTPAPGMRQATRIN